MTKINSFLRLLAPVIRPIYGGMGLILMLHRVMPKEEKPRLRGHAVLDLTPQTLESTIDYFSQKNYSFFSPDDLYNCLSSGRKPEKPFVLFTFDDGYLDNLTYAYPIFKKHHIPFAIFVSACFPDRNAVMWWYLLEDLALSKERIFFEYQNKSYDLVCNSPEEKTKTFAQLRQMFKYSNVEGRAALTQSVLIANGIDIAKKTEEIALSWNQIRELAADPLVTIGAHTVNHYSLGLLEDDEVNYEISESKRILEKQINKPVEHFAYPFGNWRGDGKREFQITAKAGFKTAMTTRIGNIFPAHASSLMTLPRYDLLNLKSQQDLNLAASGALSMRMNRFKRVVTK